jgi:hypothetical protein
MCCQSSKDVNAEKGIYRARDLRLNSEAPEPQAKTSFIQQSVKNDEKWLKSDNSFVFRQSILYISILTQSMLILKLHLFKMKPIQVQLPGSKECFPSSSTAINLALRVRAKESTIPQPTNPCLSTALPAQSSAYNHSTSLLCTTHFFAL